MLSTTTIEESDVVTGSDDKLGGSASLVGRLGDVNVGVDAVSSVFVDVDDEGSGTLVQPRLYQLVRQQGPIVDRTFEITFLQPGVEAYVFTFG